MTERFNNPILKYTNDNLKSLPGALLYFYENNTTTPKAIYQDLAGLVPHTNPVVASSTGTFPPIFLQGTYTVELKSAGGITQDGWPVDDIGGERVSTSFDVWENDYTYEIGDIRTAVNGKRYESIQEPNLNNEPSASPLFWREIVLLSAPNSVSYLRGNADGTLSYRSSAQFKTDLGYLTSVDISTFAPIYSAVKTVTQDVTSSTTYVDASGLSVTVPLGKYKFEAFIKWNGQGSTANGIRCLVSPIVGDLFFIASRNAVLVSTNTYAPASTSRQASTDGGIHLLPANAGGTEFIQIYGYVNGNQTYKIQFAQEVSSATATQVSQDSWMSLTKLA